MCYTPSNNNDKKSQREENLKFFRVFPKAAAATGSFLIMVTDPSKKAKVIFGGLFFLFGGSAIYGQEKQAKRMSNLNFSHFNGSAAAKGAKTLKGPVMKHDLFGVN